MRKIIKPIITNHLIFVHKIPNIFTNSGVTVKLCMEFLIILLNNALSLLNKFHKKIAHLFSNTIQSMESHLLSN